VTKVQELRLLLLDQLVQLVGYLVGCAGKLIVDFRDPFVVLLVREELRSIFLPVELSLV
jgi:hypothetical protein